MPAQWSGMAGDPRPDDRVFVAVVRLPHGEEKFMREAIEEAAPTMNATSSVVVASFPVASIEDSDIETGLRALGCWATELVA